MMLKAAFSLGTERLLRVGIECARSECEQMFMQLLGVSRAGVYMQMEKSISPNTEKQFFDWVSEREKRIPLAYLLGDVFFHSLKLKVSEGCLIPRPETELLVDCIVSALSQRFFASEPAAQPAILDLGCGSGAIGLALLNAVKDARAVLIDVSKEALEIARANARELNLEKRAEFILSDLFSNLPRERKFDAIVSNPPYVTDADMQSLQPEVAHEPKMALAGGADGLNFYRKIIPEAKNFLKPRGWLGFEIGYGQAEAVCSELRKFEYENIQIFKDHQQIERVILASAPERNQTK